MNSGLLSFPKRIQKPRHTGITIILDNGLPTQMFSDFIQSHHQLIDAVKFGWGTVLVTAQIDKKLALLEHYQIDFLFGGTLFEKYVLQQSLDRFYDLCKFYNCKIIEISNGTININNSEKCRYIRDFSKEFDVFSEVGYKDSNKSEEMYPAKWIEYIHQDIEAGAKKVITESRESGQSGVCRENGEIRLGLISEILASDINVANIIFEAPNKKLQTYFIKRLGSNVNLANIAPSDIVALETLRLGLRSDTLFDFQYSST